MSTPLSIEQMRISGQLPSPKGVALAIMELARRDDVNLNDIVKVVRNDPSLAGRMLRAANAANQGHRPVVAIPEALHRLGMVAVRQLATNFSLADQDHEGPCQAFDYAAYWSHSLLMAVAMRELGRQTGIVDPEELFACGLLARIGCLAVATLYPEIFADLLRQHDGKTRLTDLERAALNTDHNELTAIILADYGIPASLAAPIAHHENPEDSGFAENSRSDTLCHLFYQARRMADLGIAPQTERHVILTKLMLLAGKSGLDRDNLGEMFDHIVAQWREWAEILQVPASPLPSFAAMAETPPATAEPDDVAQQLRVLLVEDDPSTLLMLETYLADILGHAVHTARDGKEALTRALEVSPQIVVTDWLMPVMDGIEFVRTLRATEWGQTMYVIMLTSVETEDEIVQAFEAGVDDYVTKPVNSRALRARMHAAMHYVTLLDNWGRNRAQLKQFAAELAISNRKLEHYALTDQLTALNNRRAGMNFLAQAWGSASRSGLPLAVMMIDIDHFKDINDSHGHEAGDQVLREIAACIKRSSRKDDFVCRIGGEEFLVICQNAELKSTFQAAERLRHIMRDLEIEVATCRVKITISIGVAVREASLPDEASLIRAADNALYAAKQAGRDRTCLSNGGKLRCTSGHPID